MTVGDGSNQILMDTMTEFFINGLVIIVKKFKNSVQIFYDKSPTRSQIVWDFFGSVYFSVVLSCLAKLYGLSVKNITKQIMTDRDAFSKKAVD